ncbi:MAG: histidine phosphatase family protein [Ruminococcaceae bacterium]|nr:histidine phosphatase family protein [Oscillospiraceae bacterium]
MENKKPIVELELYLIRHGQSMGNAGYDKENLTLKESNDPYLTKLGISQAQKAGNALSGINFDAVYSSALLRAVQTANEIIKKQPEEKELNILPLLTETGIAPEYPGAGMEEICRICPTAKLADGITENDPLVFHSTIKKEKEMFERAYKTIDYLRSHHKSGEKVAVINHAAYMTFVIFSIMGYSNCPSFDIDFNNTGITKAVFYKEGTNKYGDIVFEYINATNHLTDKY